MRKGGIMVDRILLKLFLIGYACALIALGIVSTPPADLSVKMADLPPMTVGCREEGRLPT